MRIALACNTTDALLRFRGALIAGLAADGHEVHCVASADSPSPRLRGEVGRGAAGAAYFSGGHPHPDPPPQAGEGTEDRFAALGAAFHPWALSRSGAEPLAELGSIWRLVRLLKRLKPDLVISYTIKPNIYAAIAGRLLVIPVACVVTGLGYAFLNDTVKSRVARGLNRLALGGAGRVLFLNAADRELFVARRIVRPEQAALLPGEGIDGEHFSPAPWPGRPVRFLMAGRLLIDKGVREYAAAASTVRAEFPQAEFALLGPLDPGNPAAIGAAELAAMEASGIDYLGVAEDVRPHVAACHCVVLPSYREGVPLVLLEAGAMARPVIATDVPGCADAVLDGRTGLLCAPRDAGDLARAMREFLAMPEGEHQAMGAAGRAHVMAGFDGRAVLARYRALISEIA